ncbi:MAG: winged helix-turn-helix transcriptional regulator, partial [Thermoplasmata archaeon]|nr:winged helix-turn-helix transcriptional regulator [Thermoplasmata archaeon]
MSVRTAKKLGKAMESALKGEEGPGKAKRSFIGNRSRERIYVFLTYRPMSRQRVIAEAVGISGKTAAWHLTKLEEKEFIGCTGKSYYPTGFISHEDMGLAILFSKRGLKAVFSVVSRDPGVTQREVAEEIGLSPSQIS